MQNINIEKLNLELQNKTPEEIISCVLQLSDERIVTTSFGIYSAVLLNTFNKMDSNIKVIWCDTGLNANRTYEHARFLIRKFDLNIKIYSHNSTKTEIQKLHRESIINEENHQKFSEIVKLEPFRRAIQEHQPKVWFTNIRVRQTEYRNSQDILSLSKEGILKISPFYYWTDEDLDNYVETNNLPKNNSYFDVTKVLSNRECGIHFQ